ncbi:Eco57I restriction-modification methylase domain-containing protein [Haloprofundus salinisoli]|uniref:Eco57I restriction-modification methylase domain-containing protein n=1 Tax=Haloprofundus salinisoli TaxID=2876193 RepID=UPI001CCF8147|nr:N-6 DNA methylase [Haloprofundus salinisoli]
MTDTSAFLEALHGIGSRIDGDMSEKDVENAFLNENFYSLLGYSGAGHDLRSEWTLPDNKRPDYVTLDANESVTAIYEFKTSGKQLGKKQEDQLFHYVDELKADYGVLTNGEELRLYSRDGHARMLAVSLSEVTGSHASDLSAALQKPEWDITNPSSVNDYLNRLDAVELSGELGREHFFDTFRLEPDSPFADLVTSMVDLLRELRDEDEAKFVKGAYDFWEASYASEPDEIPDSWDSFIDGGKQELRDFMFALESGHALLARLLLAKASLDHEFFPDDRGLERYFKELGGFDGTVSLDAYPVAANGMIEDMRNQLVESLFEDDIFIWWSDGYAKETASLHKNQFNRFRDVAKEGTEVSRVSPATRERFSRAVAHVIFSVLKFDFSAVEGDPLGDLYQRYFDPETRKALGEFYTPQEVVDYIMDGVGYDMGIHDERLIDPSCGSGTFLVEAVERYIEDVERYNDDPDWEEHLTRLCTRPHIVGLDIHPFAVLMAQIRFMVAILPKYREAKRSNGDFTIRRLPIFRTDSLRNERELSGIDLGDDGSAQVTLDAMTEDNQDVRIPVPLPVEVDENEVDVSEYEDGFLVQKIRMPLFKNIRLNTGVRNFGEYFAALQGVLDVAKWYLHEGEWDYNGGLKQGIDRYTTREYDGIEEFFVPYLEEILETVRYLRTEHGDGRLFKIFEDTVLSLVVKNYMKYEYIVGNPPYVNRRYIPDSKDQMYREIYETPHWHYDLYVLFVERGLNMLTEDGSLSYIISDQFMTRRYGKKLRKHLSEKSHIKEIIDFGDTGVFEDATNYPCILTLGHGKTTSPVPVVVVHKPIELAMETVREVVNTEDFSSDDYTSFYVSPSNLSENIWSLIPTNLYSIFDNMRENGKRLDSASEPISGARIGKDDVFIGTQTSVDGSNEFEMQSGEVVKIENEILKPIVKGKDVRRWEEAWKGRYMIYPLKDNSAIDEKTLQTKYPQTHEHFKNHEIELRERVWFDQGPVELHGEWYAPMYIDDYDIYSKTCILTPALTNKMNFAKNRNGSIFVGGTAGVLGIIPDSSVSEDELLGYLNSTLVGAFVKASAPSKANGYYQLSEDLLRQVPIPKKISGLSDYVAKIRTIVKKHNNITDFPSSYISGQSGEIDYIDYEWQTRRYPVKAKIEELDDGRFAVTAGISDEITAPQMDKGDRDDRKLRAKYVHAAVNGRNMKKGEEMNIPIPKRTDDVEQLIEALEADKQTVEETSIEDLEAEIDDTVYDLFNLTEDERNVIEDYLEVF